MHTKRRKEREKEGQLLLHLWERGKEGGKGGGGGKSRLPTALHPTMEGDAKQTDGLYWILDFPPLFYFHVNSRQPADL